VRNAYPWRCPEVPTREVAGAALTRPSAPSAGALPAVSARSGEPRSDQAASGTRVGGAGGGDQGDLPGSSKDRVWRLILLRR